MANQNLRLNKTWETLLSFLPRIINLSSEVCRVLDNYCESSLYINTLILSLRLTIENYSSSSSRDKISTRLLLWISCTWIRCQHVWYISEENAYSYKSQVVQKKKILVCIYFLYDSLLSQEIYLHSPLLLIRRWFFSTAHCTYIK